MFKVDFFHDEVFYEKTKILKTNAVSSLFLNNVKNGRENFCNEDFFLLMEVEFNAEVLAYKKINELNNKDILSFFPAFHGVDTLSNFDIDLDSNVFYIKNCFLLDRIYLKNEIKLNDLSRDSELYKKVSFVLDYLVENKITYGFDDCSLFYSDDLSEIKIIDFFSVNIAWFDDFLRKKCEFSESIRNYIKSDMIYNVWDHDLNYLNH